MQANLKGLENCRIWGGWGVSNAIKYGDKDRTIEIMLHEKPKELEVSITDYGFGISLEDQKKVFEKFFRVRSNIKSAKEKGTGLGLAYVKEIVSKHNDPEKAADALVKESLKRWNDEEPTCDDITALVCYFGSN